MAGGMLGHVTKNWSLTHFCRPELYFEPSSEDELRQVLKKAQLDKKTVKVVGCGHSTNDISSTNEYMISLKKMNRTIEIDKASKTVTVEAGMLISELSEILAQNNLALSTMGFIDNMALGSVVSTGHHGSGISFGAVEDYVLELCMMLSDGEMMKLTSHDEDKELFQAARLSLGALGVIVSLKLQCEPAFNLRKVTYEAKLDDVVNNIDSHLASSEHVRFTWFPHTDRCAVFDMDRTTEPVKLPEMSWFGIMFAGYNWLMVFLFWLSSFLPFLVPWINGFYSRMISRPSTWIARSDIVFTFPAPVVLGVNGDLLEWAVPRNKFASIMEQLKRLADDAYYIHFPFDIRFVKRSSDCMLSPHGDFDSVYINVLSWNPYGKIIPFDKLTEAVEELMLKAGGKPHWGKRHGITSDQLRRMYSSFDRFVEIRNRLDPDRMFTNSYLERVLGD